jgi:hypothetical protein
MRTDFEWTDGQRAVLASIIHAPRAWTPAAGLDGSAVADLVALGVVAPWSEDRKGRAIAGGPYLTLTPWGAALLGVEVAERWELEGGNAEEVPHWAPAGLPERPVRLPRRACEYRLAAPESVPDPRPGPEQAVDDDGEPLTLFGGVPVMVDRRMGAGAKKAKAGGKPKARRRKAG